MYSWLNSYQKLLTEQFLNNTLPHAVLFTGCEGSGKQQLSQWLIALISCQNHQWDSQTGIASACQQCKHCLLLKKSVYPDHISVVSDKASLGVDSIRLASQFLEKTAQLGHYKTVFIEKAETMTEGAANALLKTLEEPNSQCFIFLTSKEPDRLLATVKSRCRFVEIKPPTGDVLLAEFNIKHERSPFCNLTHLPELTDKAQQEKFESFCRVIALFLNTGEHLNDTIDLVVACDESLRWLELIFIENMRNQNHWLSNDSSTKMAEIKLNSELMWSMQRMLTSATKQISDLHQANRQFILEKLMVDMQSALRAK